MTRRRLALFLLLSLVGCEGEGLALLVELRTDFRGGEDFVSVETEVASAPLEEAVETWQVTREAAPGDDYLERVRVAELRGLGPGTYYARISLRGPSEVLVARRNVTVTLDTQRVVTVVITRSCEGVNCPGPGDDPRWTECLGGRCVDPACTPEAPELCGPALCDGDAACAGLEGCRTARCIEGVCLCSQGAPPPDAGACAEREHACADGADDDCDGATDCADPDCAGAACDDGDLCTVNDVCADGACAGTPESCDDGNPCTDDACDPASGCVHTNNTAPCNDGNACTVNDRCNGGACSGAARTCNDGNPCTTDSCNPASGCTFTNNTNACNDGNACTVNDRCSGGTCRGSARTCNDGNPCTNDSCNPSSGCVFTPRAQHSTCGAAHLRCCGGSCVDIRTNTSHCGGCGLQCGAGFSCGQRGGLPACTCAGPHANCAGSTGSCSASSLVCSCDAAFGGSCPGPMTCHVMASGADVCTY